MPVFNGGTYLLPAVMSIVWQSFRDWELIVIDDGSNDNAIDSITNIQDERIVVLRDGINKGLAARLNEAIDLARGRYVARMDQDDVAYPERFARQLEALEHDPSLDIVATRCLTIDSNNTAVGTLPSAITHDELCARPWLGFYFPHPTWMGRTDWFRHHRYAKPGPYFCEDQELLLRTFTTSHFRTIPEVLFAYRVRCKLDWHKATRTRLTFLNIQLHKFMRERNIGRATLATAAFVLRLFSDSMRALTSVSFFTSNTQVDASERVRWDTLKTTLFSGDESKPAGCLLVKTLPSYSNLNNKVNG